MSVVLIVIVALIGSYIFYLWWVQNGKDAPFVALSPAVVEKIMKIAGVGKDDVFYDLGSGDGRLVNAAALRGAKAFGVEKDGLRVWYSRLWIKVLGLRRNAQIIHEDLFKVDLSKATVVHVFLLQSTNDKLQIKLKKELKKGTKVVSTAFRFKGWKPEKIDLAAPSTDRYIYTEDEKGTF